MMFKFKDVNNLLEVLEILGKGKSKYSIMFKKTKVSHTILKKVLRELLKNGFVLK